MADRSRGGLSSELAPGASTLAYTVTVTNPLAQRLDVGAGVYAMPYPNQAPAFTAAPLTHAEVGVAYRYDAVAVDPDGTAISYVLLQGPVGMTLDPDGGTLLWLPEATSARRLR